MTPKTRILGANSKLNFMLNSPQNAAFNLVSLKLYRSDNFERKELLYTIKNLFLQANFEKIGPK